MALEFSEALNAAAVSFLPVSGQRQLEAGGRILRFVPDGLLDSETSFQALVFLTDLAGNFFSAATVFTTGGVQGLQRPQAGPCDAGTAPETLNVPLLALSQEGLTAKGLKCDLLRPGVLAGGAPEFADVIDGDDVFAGVEPE